MDQAWIMSLPGFSIITENTSDRLLLALGIFIGIVIVLRFVIRFIAHRLQVLASRTTTRVDDAFASLILGIGPSLYIATALAISARVLVLPAPLPRIIDTVFVIVVLLQSVRILERVTMYGIQRLWFHGRGEEMQLMSSALAFIVRIVLWSVGLVLLLSNIGVDVTSLVASLGVGGIAIALAVQNILGDLLSSFSLYFDEPFRIGDFIVVGNHMGTVKKIGLKTTRIQALQGEEIVIPNRELTSVRVQNFKRMDRRRIQFSVGIVYSTSPDLVESIPSLIKDVCSTIPLVELDRVHFKSFGDSSLDFEIVYFVRNNDYNAYMDSQQLMNLGILRKFHERGIDFAFPTRTVVLEKAS